jgi:hypothetical protein
VGGSTNCGRFSNVWGTMGYVGGRDIGLMLFFSRSKWTWAGNIYPVFWITVFLIIVRKQELPNQMHQIWGLPKGAFHSRNWMKWSIPNQSRRFSVSKERNPMRWRWPFSTFSTTRSRQHITHFLFDGSARSRT